LVLKLGNRWNSFENVFLKTSFGRKIENATGTWKKISDAEPQNLQASPNRSNMAIKLRRMKGKGSGRNKKCTQNFSW